MITGDNITVGAGLSYDVASDYDTTGVSSDVHVPINKIGWGSDTITNRTTELKPIPVQMYYATGGGSTGAIITDAGAMKVSGMVGLTSDIGITGPKGSSFGIKIRRLNSGPIGYDGDSGYTKDRTITGSQDIDTVIIQGMSGGTRVGVTGNNLDVRQMFAGAAGYTGASGYGISGARYPSTYFDGSTSSSHTRIDTVAVQGMNSGFPVGVTATGWDIRYLGGGAVGYTGTTVTSTDFVAVQGVSSGFPLSVTGDVQVRSTNLDIRDLASGTDSVAVYHADGGKTLAINLAQVNGQSIGISGDSLKVAVTNSGLSLQADIGAEVYIMNPTGATSGIIVQGSTHVSANPFKISPDGGSLNVVATDLDIRNLTATDIISVGGQVKTDVGSIKTSVASTNTSVSAQTTAINSLKTTVVGLQSLVASLNSTVATIDGSKKMRVATTTSVPKTIKSGRATVTPSGTQLSPPSVSSLTNGIYIKASSSNTSTVFVGDARIIQQPNTGYPLEAGEQLFLAVADPGNVFAIAVTGNQVLHYVGS
tara:strand:- start:142 stop:1746 length:1605 start_codon:yes stop_codon:yes gene_type:complete